MEENKQVVTIDDILGKELNQKIEEEKKLEEQTTSNFIKNPLPLPKKKDHVTLDYAIKVDENDDYDLKDMTGIDFFDYD